MCIRDSPLNETLHEGLDGTLKPSNECSVALVSFCICSQDVFIECEDSYGPIEEMNICDNLGDHLVGNIYIKVHVNILL